jgi:hypothetical protein
LKTHWARRRDPKCRHVLRRRREFFLDVNRCADSTSWIAPLAARFSSARADIAARHSFVRKSIAALWVHV